MIIKIPIMRLIGEQKYTRNTKYENFTFVTNHEAIGTASPALNSSIAPLSLCNVATSALDDSGRTTRTANRDSFAEHAIAAYNAHN